MYLKPICCSVILRSFIKSFLLYRVAIWKEFFQWKYIQFMVFFLGQSRSVFTVWRWKIAVCGGSLQRPTDSHHCHLRRPCYRHHPHHRTCHRDEEEEAGCVQEERLRRWVRQWSGPGEVQRTQPGRNHLWFWKQREQSKRQVFKYDIPDTLRTKKATFLKKKKF